MRRRVASLEVVVGVILGTRGSAQDVLPQLDLLKHDDRCIALRGGSVIRNGMTYLLASQSVKHDTVILMPSQSTPSRQRQASLAEGHMAVQTARTTDATAECYTDNLSGLQSRRTRQYNHAALEAKQETSICLLYTSPSPRDGLLSRMPSSA